MAPTAVSTIEKLAARRTYQVFDSHTYAAYSSETIVTRG